MLKIINLHKNFGYYPVLQGLHWEIPKGKITGLVGVNGSGKSTLLRCIAGVYDFPVGQILLDGDPIDRHRERITFIPDEPFYLARFSTKEMKGFYQSFYPRFDEKEYQRLLTCFHFNEDKPIRELSKGLKRQSALILCLSCQPSLLMMDESFDGLDPKMRLTLKKEMVREVQDRNMTILISTHNIREIEDIADQMALLNHGKISISQTLNQLNESYHKVQLGYAEAIQASLFTDWDLVSLSIQGKVATLIYKGEEIEEKIRASRPILINPLPISMEEILVSEMEDDYE